MEDREHLRLVVDAAPVAIVVAAEDGSITLINEQGERLFGYERDELLGRSIETLVPERFRGAHPILRAGYHATPATRPMGAGRDLYGLRRDGTEVPIEIGLNFITARNGTFVLASIIDITERKHAEEMRLQRDRALDASQLKSQFVATMSHELRTPLNAIIGLAELLGETALDERQRTYVESIDQSAGALLAVISSILDFSKIEAGKVDLDARDFDLEMLVEGSAAVLAQQVRDKGLALHTYVDPIIPPTLRGDPDRLRQILLNLIGNAVKFTAHGHIVVRALPLEVSSRHAYVRFEVQDTGIGIPAQIVPKLFEPFIQADGSASRRFGGTGLGLSISKRLVELMNGEIGVSSEENAGSLFWFTARLGRPTAVTARRHINGVRAVLVAQDELFCHIVSRYLEAWGISSHCVKSAGEAVAELHGAREESPDRIAIVDADTIDAAATVEALAEKGELPASRIVSVGIRERLTKPLRQSQLFDRITEALGVETALPRRSGPPAAMPQGGPAGSVLIAEDNASLQEILVHQFAQLGIPVKIVSDGREAVDAVRRERFDLVFMDCHMPNMDGFEATRTIRAEEGKTGEHVPIVAMTANAFKEDREACLAVGMDDYLSKPVRMRDLTTMTQRWIGAGRETTAKPT